MESFLHSVSSVAIILMLTSVGYLCAAKGWMGPQSKAFLSKFLMVIAIPFMCIYGLTANLTREMILSSGRFLLVPFLAISLTFLLSFMAGKLLRLPRSKLGVFMMMCSLSNAIFIGYAMCSELFGDACTPYVMLFYLVTSAFVQLLGISLVRWSGEAGGFSLSMLLRFFKAPTVWALLVGFVLVFADIPLPSLVISFSRYMNNLVTPLALLLTGYIIYEIGLRNLHMDRSLFTVLIFRFLLSPILCLALCHVFGITGLARSVLTVESSMPVVTQTVVAATEYGADAPYAAQGAAISTLASFLVIPVLILLL